jgi:hypothetical protein
MATEFTFDDGVAASAPSIVSAVYCTSAYVQTYLNDRLGTDAWNDASAADRTKAIAMATRLIDRLNFYDDKASTAQTLQFPRGDDTEVPADIKYACCEIALRLLDGVDPELEYEALRLTTQKYSDVTIQFDKDNIQEHILAGIPSIEAWRYLRPYVRDHRSMRLERVS